MPAGDYIEGLLLFGAVLATTAGAAWMIAGGRLAALRGGERALALALITTLGLLAVHLLPAALGLLSRGAVLVTCVLWLGAAWLWRGNGGGDAGAEPRALGLLEEPAAARGLARAAWGLAALALGIVAAMVLAIAGDHLTTPTGAIDMLNFHLPNVARWIETGSIWQIDVFLPDVAPGNYPNNGDVILLAAVLPWRNDFLADLTMYPFWGLTGLAVYALAAELGAGRPAAILAACLVLAIPAVAVPALIAGLVDALMLFGFATGVLFLVRHARSGARSDLVLAGLALGIAFGTKWYGVYAVTIVLVVWAGASLLAKRGPGRVVREGLLLAGLVALAGGIWLLRNWIESGNPVFPVRVAPLGIEIFDAPVDVVREAAGFTVLDYVGDWGVWDEFILPQLRHTLAGPALLIGLALLVAAGLLAARGRLVARRGVLLAGGLCALLLVAAYSITPYSAGGPEGQPVLVAANARYVIPALLIAAIVAAAAVGLGRRLAPALGLLAIVALVDGARWSVGATNEAAAVNPLTWGAAIVATIALLALLPRLAAARRPPGWALAGAGAAALLVLAVGGYRAQRDFNEDRYVGADPALDRLAAEAPSGNRVGIAGTWDDQGISPVLPAFGERYGNEVEYVADFSDGMLRRYAEEGAFEAALERGDFDYLIVGLGRPGASAVPEREWARASGWLPLAESPRLELLRAPN